MTYRRSDHIHRLLLTAALTMTLTACSGGGGGGSDATPAPAPDPTSPGEEPVQLVVFDALPTDGSTMVNPSFAAVSFAHTGHSDLSFTLTDDCNATRRATVRRAVFDLSTPDFDEILDHRLRCMPAENTTYTTTMDGTRSNDAEFTATHSFSTGVTDPAVLTVTRQFTRTAATVDGMFNGYVQGALLADLDVSDGIAELVLDTIIEISEANWDNLTDPEAIYSVSAQRVTYPSIDPRGAPVLVSGLVAVPVTGGSVSFSQRNTMIVLTHATGSTPGDLNAEDAWFILANIFASRGYLVVAPDNYGRGETAAEPETYLMASRTAANAADLVKAVLEDETYHSVYAGNEVSIVGYSQGGHTAVGLWLMLATNGPEVSVRDVYAGGAPHNLYQTFRGVVRHLGGTCNDDVYCRHVDSDATVPFATGRILPGFLAYSETGLTLEDVVAGGNISTGFINDFLGDDAGIDSLKLQLQLSSFTTITNAQDLAGSVTTLHLYHSDFDRLVPSANTVELAERLSPHVSVEFHQGRCNGNGYELIFGMTETVGVLHTLCGLSVLDDALDNLK